MRYLSERTRRGDSVRYKSNVSDISVAEYIDVAGVRTWHLVAGEHGDPVVLLHGAFAGASSWSAQVPSLVGAGLRVYLPERRGHAHTPDVPGALSYSVKADDTCAYLEKAVAEPVHLVGWSDGAVVALMLPCAVQTSFAALF